MAAARALLILLLAASAPRAGMLPFPEPGGPAVPADAPLRLRFDRAFTCFHKGSLTVYDAGTGKAVFSLDLAAAGGAFHRDVGGDRLNVRPLILLEREAYIALPPGALQPGKAYYVDLDGGAFAEAGGAPNAALSGPDGWRFTTRLLPARGKAGYAVAADGSGDFCTLQGALDFLPIGATPVRLSVRPGTYPEPVRSVGRNRIRIVGDDKRRCVIRYANNEAFNGGATYRALARLFGDDLVLENLTFANDTPKGGTQAEALFLRGQRCVVRNCAFISFQDTLLLEGRVYLVACEVTGAVDYVWGTGTAFFEACSLISNSDGFIVQARNPRGAGGYVFRGCTLLSAGSARSYLARDGNGEYPDGQVIWIDTRMGAHIPTAGWLLEARPGAPSGFAEYRSLDPFGNPLPVAGRSGYSRQLSAAEADRFRDPRNVLGGTEGWDPRSVPASVARTGAAPKPSPRLREARFDCAGRRIRL